MQDKFLSNLGLARRAGKTILGTEQVREAIKSKKALLVLIAKDTSDSTKKEILDSARYYNTEAHVTEYSMQEFSSSLGKQSLVSSIALTDIGFKTLILKNFPHTEV